jgi:hypothetical protein
MRSRGTRSFTVELKSKRRSTATQPPSIWGQSASLFTTPPEPGSPTPARKVAAPIPASPLIGVAPEAQKQPPRVLPDLRTVEPASPEEAPPTRMTRSSRKPGRQTMRDSVKTHDKLPVEAALPAPAEATRMAAAGGAAPVELYQDEAHSEDALWESSAPSIVAAPEPRSLVGNTAMVLTPVATQRGRKWTRGVEDLPRGERWKRRLPSVCR